jgi:DNA-binding response OmpR family regulator
LATILLIEDDHDTRVTLRRNLEAEAHFVFTCTNGRDALETLKRLEPLPDVIILDLTLPIMGGEEFIARTQENRAFGKIPILAYSAQKTDCPDGACCFLAKPFDMDVLLETIGLCMSRPKRRTRKKKLKSVS